MKEWSKILVFLKNVFCRLTFCQVLHRDVGVKHPSKLPSQDKYNIFFSLVKKIKSSLMCSPEFLWLIYYVHRTQVATKQEQKNTDYKTKKHVILYISIQLLHNNSTICLLCQANLYTVWPVKVVKKYLQNISPFFLKEHLNCLLFRKS